MQTGSEGGTSLEGEEFQEVVENEEGGELQEIQSPGGDDQVLKEESARETVERILREGAKYSTEKKQDTEVQRSPDGKFAKGQKNLNKTAQIAENLTPPARFSAEEKQVFNKLSPEAKSAVSRMVKDHEAQMTQVNQQAAYVVRESQHLMEAVRPYYLKNPELMQAGLTEQGFITALVGVHAELKDTTSDRDVLKWLEIGETILQKRGLDTKPVLQWLQQSGGGKGVSNVGQVDISQHPEFRALQEKLNGVTSMIEGAQSQQEQAAINSVTQELEQLRNQVDNSGNFIYVKLHDDSTLEAMKSLVPALMGSSPGLGYVDAVKKAYAALHGEPSQVNQTRLPSTNNTNQRALSAAVTVRGRATPTFSSTDIGDMEIPPEALKDGRATAAWALEQLKRGG